MKVKERVCKQIDDDMLQLVPAKLKIKGAVPWDHIVRENASEFLTAAADPVEVVVEERGYLSIACPECGEYKVPCRPAGFARIRWSKIWCGVCKAKKATRSWLCLCAKPWHQCPKHAADKWKETRARPEPAPLPEPETGGAPTVAEEGFVGPPPAKKPRHDVEPDAWMSSIRRGKRPLPVEVWQDLADFPEPGEEDREGGLSHHRGTVIWRRSAHPRAAPSGSNPWGVQPSRPPKPQGTKGVTGTSGVPCQPAPTSITSSSATANAAVCSHATPRIQSPTAEALEGVDDSRKGLVAADRALEVVDGGRPKAVLKRPQPESPVSPRPPRQGNMPGTFLIARQPPAGTVPSPPEALFRQLKKHRAATTVGAQKAFRIGNMLRHTCPVAGQVQGPSDEKDKEVRQQAACRKRDQVDLEGQERGRPRVALPRHVLPQAADTLQPPGL
jgi:hypothetical protein